MRKISVFCALLVSLFWGGVALGAATVPLEQAVQTANRELNGIWYTPTAKINVNGTARELSLNAQVWNEHEVLVYGGPDVVPKAEQDFTGGHYRYLGYTPQGDLMPDPNFPPDHSATTLINNWDWKTSPWGGSVPDCMEVNKWDDLPENEEFIRDNLYTKYFLDGQGNPLKKPLFNDGSPPNNAAEWYKITKILQPRTSVTPGLGRMWHTWNGSLWYITVILPREITKKIDIEVVSLANPSPVLVKTNQFATVEVKNNGNKKTAFELQYSVNGAVIKTAPMSLEAGESASNGFNWSAPESAGKVILKAEAVPVLNETRIDNNVKTTQVDVNRLKKPICPNQNKVDYTWTETYSWIVHHDSVCLDDPGPPPTYSDCSWDQEFSETVTYKESLSATVTVNTKQGIPTDPDNPKDSDRESRGSWEIIPWAQKKGLNPNEVTRSGYGFEVKVQTLYDNDWEEKVPAEASPHGGTFSGPTEVTAEFYDPRGAYVARVRLVPTVGKAGQRSITWELPPKRYEFSDGTSVWERKHYTNVKDPDGKYLVNVTVTGAGHDLCLVREKEATIYGDMWDDSYTRPSNKYE